jgi:hypothetical protein
MYHAFNELQQERVGTVPTKVDVDAITEALPLIYGAIEGHTGWVVNDIGTFRLSGYAKANAPSDVMNQFTSIICCSIDKEAITDDDRVSRDLEVASALSLHVRVYVTALFKTYYDVYKDIVVTDPSI